MPAGLAVVHHHPVGFHEQLPRRGVHREGALAGRLHLGAGRLLGRFEGGSLPLGLRAHRLFGDVHAAQPLQPPLRFGEVRRRPQLRQPLLQAAAQPSAWGDAQRLIYRTPPVLAALTVIPRPLEGDRAAHRPEAA